jgi:hypothetical protein
MSSSGSKKNLFDSFLSKIGNIDYDKLAKKLGTNIEDAALQVKQLYREGMKNLEKQKLEKMKLKQQAQELKKKIPPPLPSRECNELYDLVNDIMEYLNDCKDISKSCSDKKLALQERINKSKSKQKCPQIEKIKELETQINQKSQYEMVSEFFENEEECNNLINLIDEITTYINDIYCNIYSEECNEKKSLLEGKIKKAYESKCPEQKTKIKELEPKLRLKSLRPKPDISIPVKVPPPIPPKPKNNIKSTNNLIDLSIEPEKIKTDKPILFVFDFDQTISNDHHCGQDNLVLRKIIKESNNNDELGEQIYKIFPKDNIELFVNFISDQVSKGNKVGISSFGEKEVILKIMNFIFKENNKLNPFNESNVFGNNCLRGNENRPVDKPNNKKIYDILDIIKNNNSTINDYKMIYLIDDDEKNIIDITNYANQNNIKNLKGIYVSKSENYGFNHTLKSIKKEIPNISTPVPIFVPPRRETSLPKQNIIPIAPIRKTSIPSKDRIPTKPEECLQLDADYLQLNDILNQYFNSCKENNGSIECSMKRPDIQKRIEKKIKKLEADLGCVKNTNELKQKLDKYIKYKRSKTVLPVTLECKEKDNEYEQLIQFIDKYLYDCDKNKGKCKEPLIPQNIKSRGDKKIKQMSKNPFCQKDINELTKKLNNYKSAKEESEKIKTKKLPKVTLKS